MEHSTLRCDLPPCTLADVRQPVRRRGTALRLSRRRPDRQSLSTCRIRHDGWSSDLPIVPSEAPALSASPAPPLLAAPRHSRRSVDAFCSNTAKLSRATCNLHRMAAVVQALFTVLVVFSVNRSANTAHFIHHFSPVLSTVLPGRCRPDGDAIPRDRRCER